MTKTSSDYDDLLGLIGESGSLWILGVEFTNIRLKDVIKDEVRGGSRFPEVAGELGVRTFDNAICTIEFAKEQ